MIGRGKQDGEVALPDDAAAQQERDLDPLALIYLNRLSDLLFILSRAANAGGAEPLWLPLTPVSLQSVVPVGVEVAWSTPCPTLTARVLQAAEAAIVGTSAGTAIISIVLARNIYCFSF